MKTLRNERGFTLIELVLIIVILGVLAAVAMVQFGNVTTDAKDAALQGAFGAASAQLAIAVNTAKGLPAAANAASPDFGTEVYGKLLYSTGISKANIACAANNCTFDLRTNACVVGVDRKITVTYNGPASATPGLINITAGPTTC
ncbi:MAG TPA: type II secretion system protein [Nitrospiria bacterium]|jgi:MSHA pilin protein MshA|nr:type II secretion system protein [Nitrospiria bacterium]